MSFHTQLRHKILDFVDTRPDSCVVRAPHWTLNIGVPVSIPGCGLGILVCFRKGLFWVPKSNLHRPENDLGLKLNVLKLPLRHIHLHPFDVSWLKQ